MDFIFDTNAYRTIVHGLSMDQVIYWAEKFNKCESDRGHSSAISTVVVMELIQHLIVGDPAKDDCYKSLVFAFFHTSNISPEDGSRVGSFYPPMNIILSNVFFGQNSKFMEMYNKVIDLFLELVVHRDLAICSKYEEQIKSIKSQLLFEKEEIRDNVAKFLSSLNNGVLDWKYINNNKEERDRFFGKIRNGEMSELLAYAFMIRAHQIMDAEELIPNFEEKIRDFLRNYQAAINMNLILIQAIGHGVDRLKDATDVRWNTLNDVQIMFALLYVKEGHLEKVLVTQEKKIKESAENANVGNKVINIEEYKAMIGLN